jgi:hypothetical protein
VKKTVGLGPDVHHRPIRCPHCGGLVDTSCCFFKDKAPAPGDMTICFLCRELAVYTRKMNLRLPTERELYAIAGDERLRLALRALSKTPPLKRHPKSGVSR